MRAVRIDAGRHDALACHAHGQQMHLFGAGLHRSAHIQEQDFAGMDAAEAAAGVSMQCACQIERQREVVEIVAAHPRDVAAVRDVGKLPFEEERPVEPASDHLRAEVGPDAARVGAARIKLAVAVETFVVGQRVALEGKLVDEGAQDRPSETSAVWGVRERSVATKPSASATRPVATSA